MPGDPRRSRGGGKKGRSGRKPAAWKKVCEEVLSKAKAPVVLGRIVSGDILEEIGKTKEGEPIYGETKNSDRLGAIRFLAAYAHGEPQQQVQVDGELTFRIVKEG